MNRFIGYLFLLLLSAGCSREVPTSKKADGSLQLVKEEPTEKKIVQKELAKKGRITKKSSPASLADKNQVQLGEPAQPENIVQTEDSAQPENIVQTEDSVQPENQAERQAYQAQLKSRLEDYYVKIKPFLSDDYNGVNSKFYNSKDDKTFFQRLTEKCVDFYAQLCDLVYINKYLSFAEVESGIKNKLKESEYKDYEYLGSIKRNLTGFAEELSAILLYSRTFNHFVVVFKGTVSRKDWLKNSAFRRYSGLDPAGVLTTIDGSKLNMHHGFAEAYLEGYDHSLLVQLQEAFISYFGEITGHALPFRITTTGHSLGGALAIIMANDLPRIVMHSGLFIDSSRFQVETITFAVPRIYDNESARKVEANLGGAQNIVSFIDPYDPVPNLPAKALGADDIGVQIYFGQDRLVKNLLKHSMGNYIKHSSKAFKRVRAAADFRQNTKNEIIRLKELLKDETVYEIISEDRKLDLNQSIMRNNYKLKFTERMKSNGVGDIATHDQKIEKLSRKLTLLNDTLRNE